MKETKFRAWDSINKIWIDPFKLILMRCGSVQSVESLDGEIYGTHQVFLNQYTGLKDRNGKEIYEGDVVERKEETCAHGVEAANYIVIWSDDDIGFKLKTIYSPIFVKDAAVSVFLEDDSEIIGNIYENPKLCQ